MRVATEINSTLKHGYEQLNKDIEQFDAVFPITEDMNITYNGVARLVMLDRYSFKDTKKTTLKEGDFVLLTVKEDPKYPARGTGTIVSLDWEKGEALVQVSEEYRATIDTFSEAEDGIVKRAIITLDKPLELYYEQIAMRNAHGLAQVEISPEKRYEAFVKFYEEQKVKNFIPAGRVLYGAGSGTDVTYFNCYVMPMVPDSRGGISDHRKKVMEIMSRGGGVGTNGSTLRPRHALARGVNGRSSGSVSWLDDIAKLTHLVEQGGSRRGAQMIMLTDWHPDIIEFIISKMQNPRILRYIIENFEDEQIRTLAHNKLRFTPFSPKETNMYTGILNYKNIPGNGGFDDSVIRDAELKLRDGGTYTVNDSEFLTGANISVCITDEFMAAVKANAEYELRFPDVENYSEEEMAHYDAEWVNVGDVREWEAAGHAVRVYRSIKARELWKLINVCATYAAEPGIFFIDNANKMTNAQAYGQKVVATNPCGEQPLAPYSVCNLAAVNLAEMVNKDLQMVDFAKLEKTVRMGVHMQDNVIDSTPYFLEENRIQALGERRVGLGIMGLADMLIYCGVRYGSEEGNQLIDQVFQTIAVTAYEESIELAKERGSFPFLVGETGRETQELREKFVNSGFMSRMPEHVREGVLKYGIRNSHLLTVAPTGSTGTMAGVSTGLEPYFSFSYFRSGRLGKFIEVKAEIVQEYLDRNPDADPDNLPDFFTTAMALSPEEHVDVQTTIQRWVDSSISKTVNAPRGYNVEQVEKIYERLYDGGAKGGTVYVDGSRDSQVLTLKAEENLFEDDYEANEKEAKKVNKDKTFLVESIVDLESTDVTIGNEIGDTCPICRIGTVEDLGGCNTCNNCAAQLKCGL
ncbi:vitamin B12-dependent ribonucleotide reductase [Jeotgalibaca porci]|uniref:vitamin B12-dependent ribonucleotide reductase n=3 Tax=Jeotgalibaca porci TaxID=1868793 RepID=UPI00359F5E54